MIKFIIASLVFGFPLVSFAQLSPPKVIALVPPGNNLENENQIEDLCPKSSLSNEACRKERLSPRTWELGVYEGANAKSKFLGKILVTGTPGKGLEALYKPVAGSQIKLPSDSKETDWGYSSFFEFTVSKVAGDWIQLPKRPFVKPVWINIKKDWSKKDAPEMPPEPRELETDTVYSAGSLGDIVITNFSGKEFRYRKENRNDMSCGESKVKVAPADLREFVRPITDLYDKDGHLIVWIKYSRGC